MPVHSLTTAYSYCRDYSLNGIRYIFLAVGSRYVSCVQTRKGHYRPSPVRSLRGGAVMGQSSIGPEQARATCSADEPIIHAVSEPRELQKSTCYGAPDMQRI
ncbi:hypothetical protein EVAR_3345_1 [Eumeta japonica]|uniref:Uncharacterized protein n=1 Tax=Eumeta variegata TaxID=151549 RepID=A0A4C1SS77_EUMVA|nr:hypothetical protein EVAR_3345_1 [Eumeta japonica]